MALHAAGGSFRGTIASGTLTADGPGLTITQTWNNVAVTFTAAKINITDTTSANASMLLDLQVGGSSKFNVSKFGAITADSVTLGTWFCSTSNGTSVSSALPFGWSNGNASGTKDVLLYRDAAAQLALRNTTTAQSFRVYRTYTDASNYQRVNVSWNTTTALIMNEGLGTGKDGSVAFNDAALATNATKGFLMIPGGAGIPTGVPADIPTGQVPLYYDTTNNKLYVYNGAWKASGVFA